MMKRKRRTKLMTKEKGMAKEKRRKRRRRKIKEIREPMLGNKTIHISDG